MSVGVIVGQTNEGRPLTQEEKDFIAQEVLNNSSITATYPVAAGQSIQAGDVVDVVNGEVVSEVEKARNMFYPSSGFNLNYSYMTSADFNKDYAVALEYSNNRTTNNLCVFLYNKVTGAQLANKIFSGFSATSYQFTSFNIFPIDDSRILVLHPYASNQSGVSMLVVTPNEDAPTLSLSDPVLFGNKINLNHRCTTFATYLGNKKILVVYGNTSSSTPIVRARIGTINAGYTDITWTAEFNIPNINDTADTIKGTELPSDTQNIKKFCICFTGQATNPSATIISVDNVVNYNNIPSTTASVYYYNVCASLGDTIAAISVLKNNDPNDYSYVCLLKAQNMTLSILEANKQLARGTAGSKFSYDIISFNNKFIVTYSIKQNASAKWESYVSFANINNNIFTLEKPYSVYTPTTTADRPTNFPTLLASNDYKRIYLFNNIMESRGGVSTTNLPNMTIFEYNSWDDIAGKFIQISSEAIAMESGEAGTNINIIYEGYNKINGFPAGTLINSAGVVGYFFHDNMITVSPAFNKERTKIIIGNYVGNGLNGINNKNVLFAPSNILAVSIAPARSINDYSSLLLIKGCANGISASDLSSNPTDYLNINFDGNKFEWYGASAVAQLNTNNILYAYIIFCE